MTVRWDNTIPEDDLRGPSAAPGGGHVNEKRVITGDSEWVSEGGHWRAIVTPKLRAPLPGKVRVITDEERAGAQEEEQPRHHDLVRARSRARRRSQPSHVPGSRGALQLPESRKSLDCTLL